MKSEWQVDREKWVKQGRYHLYGSIASVAIALVIGLTDFGRRPASGEMIAVGLGIGVIVIGAMWLTVRNRARTATCTIGIDFGVGSVEFRNVTFATNFVLNRRSKEVVVSFSEILGARIAVYRGVRFIEITTSRGVTSVSGLEDLESLHRNLHEIIKANKDSSPDFERRISAVPRPRTPWWGWLLLGAAIAAISVAGWLTLK